MPSDKAALGSFSVDRIALKTDGAGAGLVHAGEDLDQRRLAGAVVANQRHHFACVNVEIDIGQRRDGAEMLGDAPEAKYRLAGRSSAMNGRSAWSGRSALLCVCHALASLYRKRIRAERSARPQKRPGGSA
jgi:hypothetical protein